MKKCYFVLFALLLTTFCQASNPEEVEEEVPTVSVSYSPLGPGMNQALVKAVNFTRTGLETMNPSRMEDLGRAEYYWQLHFSQTPRPSPKQLAAATAVFLEFSRRTLGNTKLKYLLKVIKLQDCLYSTSASSMSSQEMFFLTAAIKTCHIYTTDDELQSDVLLEGSRLYTRYCLSKLSGNVNRYIQVSDCLDSFAEISLESSTRAHLFYNAANARDSFAAFFKATTSVFVFEEIAKQYKKAAETYTRRKDRYTAYYRAALAYGQAIDHLGKSPVPSKLAVEAMNSFVTLTQFTKKPDKVSSFLYEAAVYGKMALESKDIDLVGVNSMLVANYFYLAAAYSTDMQEKAERYQQAFNVLTNGTRYLTDLDSLDRLFQYGLKAAEYSKSSEEMNKILWTVLSHKLKAIDKFPTEQSGIDYLLATQTIISLLQLNPENKGYLIRCLDNFVLHVERLYKTGLWLKDCLAYYILCIQNNSMQIPRDAFEQDLAIFKEEKKHYDLEDQIKCGLMLAYCLSALGEEIQAGEILEEIKNRLPELVLTIAYIGFETPFGDFNSGDLQKGSLLLDDYRFQLKKPIYLADIGSI